MAGLRRAGAIAALACVLALLLTGVGVADAQNDCGTGGDAGGDPSSASELNPIPATCTGALAQPGDDADWFKFDLKQGQQVKATLTVTDPAAGAALEARKPNGDPVACANSFWAPDTCNVRADTSGSWKLGVIRELGSPAYQLDLTVTSPQTDCAAYTDPAAGEDAPEQAPGMPIVLADATDTGARSAECAGTFDDKDQSDVYRFFGLGRAVIVVAVPSLIQATLTDPAGNAIGDVSGGVLSPANPATGFSITAFTDLTGYYNLALTPQATTQTTYPTSYSVTISESQKDCLADDDVTPRDAPNTTAEGLKVLPQADAAADNCVLAPIKGALDPQPRDPRPGDDQDLTPADIEDHYGFGGQAGVPVRVSLVASTGNCYELTVTDPDEQQTVRKAGDDCATPDGDVQLDGKAGTWDVRVRAIDGKGGTRFGGKYELAIGGALADCGIAGDAGNLPADARPVPSEAFTPSALCKGTLGTASDVDLYKFAAPKTAIIDASATRTDSVGAPPSLRIVRPGGQVIEDSSFRVPEDGAGDWMVEVSGPAMSYDLVVTLIVQNDCGIGFDAGNDPGHASAITLPQVALGRSTPLVCDSESAERGSIALGPAGVGAPLPPAGAIAHQKDPEDWYKFSVSNDVTILSVVLMPGPDPQAGGDLDLYVIDPTGQESGAVVPRPNGQAEIVLDNPCAVAIPPSTRPCRGRDGGGVWKIGVRYVSGPLGRYDLIVGEAHA